MLFFFFKQKTAYEMRISDWSSDVCSSDLRGSDINLIAQFAVPRRLIRWAAEAADGVITVSIALADKQAGLGIERGRITVLRNGVDPPVIRPVEASGRESPGRGEVHPPRPLAVSVGNRVPSNGDTLETGKTAGGD